MSYIIEIYNWQTKDTLTTRSFNDCDKVIDYLWEALNGEENQNYNEYEIDSVFDRLDETYQFCIGDNRCVKVTAY